MRNRRRLFLAAILGLFAAERAKAQTIYYWQNPFGNGGASFYNLAGNWSANASSGGAPGVPGALDFVRFGFLANETTSLHLFGSVANAGFIVAQGTVNLHIGSGQTYTISGVNQFSMGAGGVAATLNILSGRFSLSGNNNVGAYGIGAVTGSAGTVNVFGAGTEFNSAGSLDIGSNGTGFLNVSDFAAATLTGAFSIGTFVGGVGTLAISGSGSVATPAGFNVGFQGTGTLNVFSGGTLNSGNTATFTAVTIATQSGSLGTANIAGAWNHSFGAIIVGNNAGGAGSGSLGLSAGGAVNLTGSTGSTGITVAGNGTVRITGGTLNTPNFVTRTNGLILTGGTLQINGGTFDPNAATYFLQGANDPTLVLNGANANVFDGTNRILNIGFTSNNSGTLRVQGGATPILSGLRAGSNANATGNLIVDGANTNFRVGTGSNFLALGELGTGTVTVRNGGKLTADNGTTLGLTNTGNGALTVTGAGSQYAGIGNTVVGDVGTGTFNLQQGGSATVSRLILGGSGSGTLNIGAGSTLTTSGSNGAIAFFAGSTGTANISGAWNHSGGQFWVGGSANVAGGNGTLNVSTGGTLNVTGAGNGIVILGTGTAPNNGTVNLTGGTIQTPNFTRTTSGAFNFTGGTLQINGGTFAPDAGTQYNLDGENNPTLVLNGPGANYSNGASVGLVTGLSSGKSGTFEVRGGATPTFNYFNAGSNSGSTGNLLIDGAGSILTTSGNFYAAIGVRGSATATLTNGGQLAASPSGLVLGAFSGSSGTLNVGGTNSTLTLANQLQIGGFNGVAGGTGVANLNAGGTIHSTTVRVYAGGTFNLNGGTLNATGLTLLGGTANLNSGLLNLTGGISNEGLLLFNTSVNNWTVSQSISGAGSLQTSGLGSLILTGTNTFSGGTLIQSGTLQIGNGGAAGSIAGNIVDNGILAINLSGNLTLGGTISGTGSVVQAGFGTTTLTGPNTYSGGTTINRGTIAAANDAVLGSGQVTLTAFGTMAYTGNTATSRTFNLNGGTLLSTSTLTFNGASVGGGYLGGNFATQAGSTSVFAGATSLPSASITLTSNNLFANFNHGGLLTANGGVSSISGFNNQAAGRVIVNSGATLNTVNFQSVGTLAVNGTGVINNTSGTDFVLGGGSVTTLGTYNPANGSVAPGGTINIGSRDIIVQGGLLRNNGVISGSGRLIVDYGGLAKGAGDYDTGGTILRNGGVLQAGNSPGLQRNSNPSFVGAATVTADLNNATGVMGGFAAAVNGNTNNSGWGAIEFGNSANTTSGLTLQRGAAGPVKWQFRTTLNDGIGDTPGNAANFVATNSYTWTIFRPRTNASASNPIPTLATDQLNTVAMITLLDTGGGILSNTNFNLNQVLGFDSSLFRDPATGLPITSTVGTFSFAFGSDLIGRSGTTISVVYTPSPVPEPASMLLLGGAAFGVLAWRSRRNETPSI